ncbi:MFS transporter [Alkalibaculum sp. M08DMB]|uniref:MFS transporter n=1 Tax=Alkalibaculum sporogenes TaxID=2655001 RepID=A0A6A7KD45_9FIRM|nr:OFA family MFS transporter [Alkalibaculum sporogenes]MPW27251.1 MFS transporter [Alkalibaculum sporogenes]
MRKIINQKITESKRWFYVLLGIIIMMCLGTVYSWSVFRLGIEEMFEIGTTQSGLPYMVSLAFYAIFMLLTGRHIDKHSPRLIISVGAMLVALGWILSSFTSNVYMLTITYGVIIGSGVGIAYGAPITVVTRWFPEKKGLAVGLILIGFGLSPLVTAPLARNLIEIYGIMKVFLILGISFGVIIPILAYPLKYPTQLDNRKSTDIVDIKDTKYDINTRTMIKSDSFKGLYFNFLIGTMIGLMLIGMTSKVGVELVGLSSRNIAILISIFAVFNGLGRPIFGWITDKLSSRKAMLISYGLITTAALLMLMAETGSLLIFAISFSIFWFNLGGWLAIAPTSTLSMYGTQYYSQNYGVIFTAYGIGAILGVLASGLIMDVLENYYSIFYLVISLCIIGVFITFKSIKS